jgi:protein-tyrosine-phosphatase
MQAMIPNGAAVIAEVGIGITREVPKPRTGEVVQAANVVVTMDAETRARSSPESVTRTGNYSAAARSSPSSRRLFKYVTKSIVVRPRSCLH